MSDKQELLTEKLSLLPAQPGVYLMKNAQGEIIYVGKAAVLRNRVRSYFRASGKVSPKVEALVARIVDFEYIVTANAIEALILECNLIKKHRPKYNVMLKDDKSYPYLKVTLTEDYPRIFSVRRLVKDGSRYFGPYANVNAMNQTLKTLRMIFPLRTCRQMNARRPCLEYHIKRCLGPCSGQVDKGEYHKMVEAVCLFLEGRSDLLIKQLKKQMQQAAEDLCYEQAACLRDQINALESLHQQQTAVTIAGEVDVIGLAADATGTCVQVFFVREGKLIGRDHFLLTGSAGETKADILMAFIQQYYSTAAFIPREILLPLALPEEEQSVLGQWLGELKGQKVTLLNPQRGMKKDLLVLAEENAQVLLKEENSRQHNKEQGELAALTLLAQKLGIKSQLSRIDCFDISHTQGSETVASMVVFRDGAASKRDYRRYKLKTVEGKPDDFKSMAEVVLRRYRMYEDLPELVIVDGGKGQLSSALEVIRGLGLEMPVIGLAERFEEIYQEGSSLPLRLEKDCPALHLMQRIRDEAHRFAVTYHRKLRSKRNLVSVLDHVPGIGATRRQALWQKFASLQSIKNATVDELASAPGMNRASAQAVYDFFRRV